MTDFREKTDAASGFAKELAGKTYHVKEAIVENERF